MAFAAPPQSGLTWFCFLFPLIALEVRISRIQRSEKAHGFAHDGRITVGGDKGFDTKEFVRECRHMKVTPHVGNFVLVLLSRL